MGAPEAHPSGDLADLLDVSQHGEASIVGALVEPGWPRYLVDVGAHDGRSLSNSFPFLQLGWAGTLVEPLPQAFERLAELYRDRPEVRCVAAACSDWDGQGQLAVGEDGPSTMTSTLHAEGAPTRNSIPVAVRTLTSVLDEAEAPRDFSLLLVDAERTDYSVLAGLDFARYRPRVIVTEDDVANAERHAEKYRFLQDRGYVLYAVVASTNSIWVSSSLVARAHAPGVDGAPTPLLSPQEALDTISRRALERRCAELERSRDEIWRRLTVVETSRSWRLTRPLRRLGRALRSLRGRGLAQVREPRK
jgi:FkbM family methyltransferase